MDVEEEEEEEDEAGDTIGLFFDLNNWSEKIELTHFFFSLSLTVLPVMWVNETVWIVFHDGSFSLSLSLSLSLTWPRGHYNRH